MSQSEPTMNRRDWFRLRQPRSESPLPASDLAHNTSRLPLESNSDLGTATAMQPIALPPNHDGMDLAKLPPMREAQLSLDEVLALLADVETYGTEVRLIQRERLPGTRAEPNGSAMAFELARQAIMNGTVSRLQIRYSWQGAFWIDTLEASSSCFRLVRIEHR